MINEFTGNVRNVSSLANKPALTPEELKAVFDKTGIDLKEYINETLVPEINNELSGKVSAINGKRRRGSWFVRNERRSGRQKWRS